LENNSDLDWYLSPSKTHSGLETRPKYYNLSTNNKAFADLAVSKLGSYCPKGTILWNIVDVWDNINHSLAKDY
jgi:hypothetical protein